MSIALFPSGEPLRVSIHADWVGSRNGALIGFAQAEGGAFFGLIVDEMGNIVCVETANFTVDWRYDVEQDRWVDASRSDETDQNP